MIWFKCKNCGKVLGRPDSSAGAMVFCDCGAGARVPWESSATAPEPTVLVDEPIRFEAPAKKSLPELPVLTLPSLGRKPNEPVDPEYCFNHSSIPKAAICVDCKLSFCPRCLVTFQGKPRCAPCKNYQTRLLQRRPSFATFSLTSFVSALIAGPMLFFILPYTAGAYASWLTMLILLPQAFALATGIRALAAIQKEPSLGGRHLAFTGVGMALFVCLLGVLMTVYSSKIWS